jgi:hypothetical protein
VLIHPKLYTEPRIANALAPFLKQQMGLQGQVQSIPATVTGYLDDKRWIWEAPRSDPGRKWNFFQSQPKKPDIIPSLFTPSWYSSETMEAGARNTEIDNKHLQIAIGCSK